MKKFLHKLKDQKGEVSVEWVLVAVIMGIVIVATFMPNVETALTTGINRISTTMTSAGTAP
jgi:Flp pilus assembly pilin Flp